MLSGMSRSTISAPIMRVFISYAHTEVDKPLAQFIARRLAAEGIDVWMDERSLHGGQRVQKTIEDAAASCSHAVFLVSRSWLDRDWTNWELGLFDGRTPPATLVPVWRRDRKLLKLPPQLYQLTGFHWAEMESDLDARVWELRCALRAEPPGPSSSCRSRKSTAATRRSPVPQRRERR
ncbi:MAG: toll/interleukin-1 receptor domain-containing protein, partial [Vicinamibacterales bacterium]